MSTEYHIYTEVKINGKWELIDGKYKDIKSGKYTVTPMYMSGSRSYFSACERKLKELSSGRPKEISDDLKMLIKNVFDDDRSLEDLPVTAISFEEVKKLANGYDHHGFVHKDDIELYQSGETEDIYLYWEGTEEDSTLPQTASRPGFWALTPEERAKVFGYMEWDDADGWRGAFKEIAKRAEMRIEDFCGLNYTAKPDEIRLLLFVY